MSARRDIHLDRGADWAATVDVSSAGSPVDLSAYTVSFYLDGLSSSRILGDTSISGGRITLGLTNAVTAGLSMGVGSWELWLTNAGKLTRLYTGSAYAT